MKLKLFWALETHFNSNREEDADFRAICYSITCTFCGHEILNEENVHEKSSNRIPSEVAPATNEPKTIIMLIK